AATDPSTTGRTTAPIASPAEHRHLLADDLQPTAVLSRLLVLPGIHLQAALNQHRPPLCQIFPCDLRRSPPERDIDECHFLFAGIRLFIEPLPINSQPNVGDRCPIRNVANLGVACEISNQNDFVEAGHVSSPSYDGPASNPLPSVFFARDAPAHGPLQTTATNPNYVSASAAAPAVASAPSSSSSADASFPWSCVNSISNSVSECSMTMCPRMRSFS